MESEAFEDIQKGGGALRTVKDLSAGALGGIAQVLIGMYSSFLYLTIIEPFNCQLKYPLLSWSNDPILVILS